MASRLSSWIAATTARDVGPPTSTGPTLRSVIALLRQRDPDATIGDPHRYRIERGAARVDATACAEVVRPLMRGAGQRGAVQPPRAESHALMWAAIAIRSDLAVDVDEQHGHALDLDAEHLALPHVVLTRGEVLGHR